MSRFLRLLRVLGGILAIAYTSACLFLLLRQNYFIFKPSSVIQKTPAFFKLHYQDVWLPVKTGSGKVERIHGWWIPAARPKLGTMLYLHGNGINIGANVNQSHRFHKLGFSVLLIDYRGYGRSEGGFPTEYKMYQDAETAWRYLVKERRIPANQIFIYGHSLGGAIAIDLAVRHPEAAGLVVQSSFTSMQKMVERYAHLQMFPVSLLLTQRFDSVSKVKSLRMPVLFIHGTADQYIPAAMSRKLYATTPRHKQLLLVKGVKHNNGAAEYGTTQHLQSIRRFVER